MDILSLNERTRPSTRVGTTSQGIGKELDILLFNRNKRTVELTEAGRIFLPEAIKTLEQANYAVTQAKRAQAGAVGKIEIGYSSGSVLSGVLGAILRRYREAFPDVEFACGRFTRPIRLSF